jgi:mono/diheme cytochrome c family protein/cytochrome c553
MWALALCLLAAEGPASADPTAEQIRFFETSIRPILVEHCLKCHGKDKQWASFRLDTREGLFKGGDGGPVIVAGEPEKSRLIEAVRQTDPDFKMPPVGKLTDRQIADLIRWIQMGAPYPKTNATAKNRSRDPNHWAFQPPVAQAIPDVGKSRWPQTAIDHFILQKLVERELVPSEPASRPILIRRITFDLIGLPPTPDEIDEFVADARPDAVARLADRLLASPHYGERWGRHWLDVARYADSNGLDENVAHGNAWRYRDYVVSAWNRDMPYNRFLKEQLAGDMLPAADEAERRERLIATGFLGMGPKVLAEVDEAKMQMDIVDEQIESVGRAVLGMTFGCARCHDHKFDPIDTADYYGLAGIFKSTRTMETYKKVARWHENPLPSDDARALKATYDQQLADKQRAVDMFLAEAKEALQRQHPGQKPPETLEAQFPEEIKKKLKQLRDDLEAFKKNGPELPSAMGVTEDKTVDVAIHIRGNPLKLGDVVPRHVPPVMRGPESPPFPVDHSGRLELADWLTDRRHPLTSRVMVNRIWRWHFGRGIVPTVDNFGLLGEKPSHPELLDWLALRFISDGWSIKALHRMIVTSNTYQQTSRPSSEQLEKDPENRLFGRAHLRRLEAEEVRDALLAISGCLDTTMGGSLLTVKNRAYFFDHTSIDKTDYSSRRRALYLPIVRNNVYDVFQLLDFPDPAVPTGDRSTTTVAPQALLMLNSDFVMQAAGDLARRVARESADHRQRLARLFVLAYGREATGAELDSNLTFLAETEKSLPKPADDAAPSAPTAWDVLCHVIVAANEFVYVQ